MNETYTFAKTTVPIGRLSDVPYPEYEPYPIWGVLAGATLGGYTVALIVTQLDMAEWFLWVNSVLITAMGAFVFPPAFARVVHHFKLKSYNTQKTMYALKFLKELDLDWGISLNQTLDAVEQNEFIGKHLTDAERNRWKIVDVFQDENEIVLTMRLDYVS